MTSFKKYEVCIDLGLFFNKIASFRELRLRTPYKCLVFPQIFAKNSRNFLKNWKNSKIFIKFIKIGLNCNFSLIFYKKIWKFLRRPGAELRNPPTRRPPDKPFALSKNAPPPDPRTVSTDGRRVWGIPPLKLRWSVGKNKRESKEEKTAAGLF